MISTQKTVIPQRTPVEMTEVRVKAVLRQRLKNPAWTVAFCLVRHVSGMLLLGELLKLGRYPDDAVELHVIPVRGAREAMLVVCAKCPGVSTRTVERLVGPQSSWPSLAHYPSLEPRKTRVIVVDADNASALYRFFFEELVEGPDLN